MQNRRIWDVIANNVCAILKWPLIYLKQIGGINMTILDRITRKSKNIAAFSKREIICAKMRERLENENFSIISSNCIGGILCHDLNVRYNSPTVNMFFVAADFVKFCSRIPYYTTRMIIQWRKLMEQQFALLMFGKTVLPDCTKWNSIMFYSFSNDIFCGKREYEHEHPWTDACGIRYYACL